MGNIYDNTIKDIKSALFDVVSSETENISILEDKLNTVDDVSKKDIEKTISLKKSQLHNIRESLSSIVNSIEILSKDFNEVSLESTNNISDEDSLNVDNDANDFEFSSTDNEKEEVDHSNVLIKDDLLGDVEENDNSNEEEVIINEDVTGDSEEVEDDNSVEEEITINEDVTGDSEEVEDDNSVEEETTVNEDVTGDSEAVEDDNSKDEVEENIDNSMQQESNDDITSTKYQFIKKTNNATKAILVTKVQYEKLSDSLDSQTYFQKANGNLSDLKGFDENSVILAQDQAKLQKQQFAQQLNDDIKKKESEGIDKDRQIEDLMVKANIYNNEGETEKAQAIYEKIDEIQSGNQGSITDENPVLVKAA